MPADDLPRRLRVEVGRFREREQRRTRFPARLHAGVYAGERTSIDLPSPAGWDHALRVELALVVVEAAPDSADAVWLTRPGPAEPGEHDSGWVAAIDHACGIAGSTMNSPSVHVITRHGWVDLRSGATREWKRLRL